MSEKEWLSQTDARSMLQAALDRWSCWDCLLPARYNFRIAFPHLCPSCAGSSVGPLLTPRKLRLIACAVCRAVWDELTGEPAREAVLIAERFADGLATPAELTRARLRATAPAARDAADNHPVEAATGALEQALARLRALHESELSAELHAQLTEVSHTVEASCGHLPSGAIKRVRRLREQRFRDDYSQRLNTAITEDRMRLCAVLYDLLGNPFAPVPIRAEWLEADGGRVRQVAAAIYQDADFEAMPVLADALQDAGCRDERLLEHCLQDGHYRGCWLLGALLGMR